MGDVRGLGIFEEGRITRGDRDELYERKEWRDEVLVGAYLGYGVFLFFFRREFGRVGRGE